MDMAGSGHELTAKSIDILAGLPRNLVKRPLLQIQAIVSSIAYMTNRFETNYLSLDEYQLSPFGDSRDNQPMITTYSYLSAPSLIPFAKN